MRELVYPLTEMAIVFAMAFFWTLFAIMWFGIAVVGVIGAISSLILLLFVAPGLLRYLFFLLEARANGHEAPAFDAEWFGAARRLWALMPAVTFALLAWLTATSAGISVTLSLFIAIVATVLWIASTAVLAVTHSPLESLNPLAIARMIRAAGPSFAWIPVIVVLLVSALFIAAINGAPVLLVAVGASYLLVLTFTLTGKVLAINSVADDVRIEAPSAKSEQDIADELVADRQSVASHAYAFISRGNRDGGFLHVRQSIERDPDPDAAAIWYFNEMMRWEDQTPALFFAQEVFAHLLHHGLDAQALKVIAQCQHVNPRWKPRAGATRRTLEPIPELLVSSTMVRCSQVRTSRTRPTIRACRLCLPQSTNFDSAVGRTPISLQRC